MIFIIISNVFILAYTFDIFLVFQEKFRKLLFISSLNKKSAFLQFFKLLLSHNLKI